MKKDFLSVADCTAGELKKLLDCALAIKLHDSWYEQKPLTGRTLVAIYEKPSLRTRLSFHAAIAQLGGSLVELKPEDIGMGSRESLSDIASVISHLGDILIARTFAHQTLVELAAHSSISVVNALSDREHPCQALADFLTIMEVKGLSSSLHIAYVGDAENNVTHSLALAAALLGVHFLVGSPSCYQMDSSIYQKAKQLASQTGAQIYTCDNPFEAVDQADVVITDTWVSMGDEKEKGERLQLLKSFQVNKKLMAHAKKDAIFLHYMPVYRGFEVSAEVVDGSQSYIFPEVENRLHVQKALLTVLFEGI